MRKLRRLMTATFGEAGGARRAGLT